MSNATRIYTTKQPLTGPAGEIRFAVRSRELTP
jgi:hypothetical protein